MSKIPNDDNQKTILFTGGGSAGHVTPNIALIQRFKTKGWNIEYVGSVAGIEREIIAPLNIPYHPISTGKLRRYLTWQHALVPFHVLKGIWQSYWLCKKIKPTVIFSKGGFVSLPLVIGGWLNRVTVMIHEADITPGLANKLSAPFAQHICITNELAKKYYKNQHKIIVTGIPVRPDLLQGSREAGLAMCKFNSEKPTILVFGGSLGSASLNKIIQKCLARLLNNYQIAHICGKNKMDSNLNQPGYCQFEFLNKEMPDMFAAADLVISRAGANSIYELLSLKKPHILVPLPTTASRGDQIDNAKYYAERELSTVIFEEDLSEDKLIKAINRNIERNNEIIKKLKSYDLPDSVAVIEKTVTALVQ